MRTDHQRDVAADGSVEDDQFVRQLKELVSVLRDEDVDPLDQCSAVDQQCDHDAAAGDGRSCCRGLRCSAAGKCVLDCVSDASHVVITGSAVTVATVTATTTTLSASDFVRHRAPSPTYSDTFYAEYCN